MAITINTQVIRYFGQESNNGLTLVVLSEARLGTWNSDHTVFTPGAQGLSDRIINTADLYNKLGPGTGEGDVADKAYAELNVVDYLLRQGVNVYVLTTAAVGTITATDLAKANDIDNLGYQFVMLPNYKLTQTSTAVMTALNAFVADKDIEVYLDLNPGITPANAKTVVALANNNPKFSFFEGFGIEEGTPAYDGGVNFIGIPASAAVITRKAAFIANGTPWLAAAGQVNGLFPEFINLNRKMSTQDKNLLQAEHVNVLNYKVGVGALMTSQNTALVPALTDKNNPLVRGHVVTELMYIKRKLNEVSDGVLYLPHTQNTWDAWTLKVKAFMEPMFKADGLVTYRVVADNRTMSKADIENNLFKAVVSYVPVGAIESIVITLQVHQNEGTIVANVGGLI